jgi:organic radical activating enzyme
MGVASDDTKAVAAPDLGSAGREQHETKTTYRVKNVFETVQGEGFWAGRPAVFVRLVGCNMWSGYEEDRERDAERTGADCPLWCDTDFTKEGSEEYTASALTDRMREVGGDIDFCVLTGGEPFLQADANLIQSLHRAGYRVSIETNGTVSMEEAFWSDDEEEAIPPDWITCSPKLPEDRLQLERFDELKLVVPDYRPSDYQNFAERGTLHALAGEKRRVLLVQPEDGPRLEEAERLAVQIATENPSWQVSVQTHKILGVE